MHGVDLDSGGEIRDERTSIELSGSQIPTLRWARVRVIKLDTRESKCELS